MAESFQNGWAITGMPLSHLDKGDLYQFPAHLDRACETTAHEYAFITAYTISRTHTYDDLSTSAGTAGATAAHDVVPSMHRTIPDLDPASTHPTTSAATMDWATTVGATDEIPGDAFHGPSTTN